MAARTIWKGAISFGLVHIPVGLYPATREESIDFDWLDSRTMDPVGYKRINKKTGKEVDKSHIVKGVAYAPGKYVVLSDDEIKSANPKSTQTIDILAFVDADEIPFVYLETPYYLAPIARGEKVYALLRDTLKETGKYGVAKVVLHSKQHLAAVIATESALVLNLLRWGGEVRAVEDVPLGESAHVKITPAERKMAAELVENMAAKWDPKDYSDTFRDDIMALVDRKIKAGKTTTVEKVEEDESERPSAQIIDLTELLKQSLKNKGQAPAKKSPRKSASPKSGSEEKAPAPRRKKA